MDQKVVLAQMDPTDGFLFNWRLHLIRMLDWCLVVEVTIKDVENKFITA